MPNSEELLVLSEAEINIDSASDNQCNEECSQCTDCPCPDGDCPDT